MNQGCVIHHSVINTINHHAILKKTKTFKCLETNVDSIEVVK